MIRALFIGGPVDGRIMSVREGVDAVIIPVSREASWASVQDPLVNREVERVTYHHRWDLEPQPPTLSIYTPLTGAR